MSSEPAIAANWYEDPHDPSQLRWWDGSTWTDHVAPNPAQATPAVAAVPAATSVPASTPVPGGAIKVPTLSAVATPAASMPNTDSKPAASSRSSTSPRTLALIVGAVAVIAAAVLLVPKIAGGDDPVIAPDPAASTAPGVEVSATGDVPATSPAVADAAAAAGSDAAAAADPAGTEEGAAAATAQAGAPLEAKEYAEKLRALTSGDGIELPENATPAQMQTAIAEMKLRHQGAILLVPPTQVASEHAALTAALGRMVEAYEGVAKDPTDQAAIGAVTGASIPIVSAAESIEKKLGVSVLEQTSEQVVDAEFESETQVID